MEAVGIRLNTKKPDIYFKEKKGGGLAFNATCNLTHVDEKMVSRGHWIGNDTGTKSFIATLSYLLDHVIQILSLNLDSFEIN